jgi:hypothetical protein
MLFYILLNMEPRMWLYSIQMKLIISVPLWSSLHSTLHSIINFRYVNHWALLQVYASLSFFNRIGMKARYSSLAYFIRMATSCNGMCRFLHYFFDIGIGPLERFQASFWSTKWFPDESHHHFTRDGTLIMNFLNLFLYSGCRVSFGIFRWLHHSCLRDSILVELIQILNGRHAIDNLDRGNPIVVPTFLWSPIFFVSNSLETFQFLILCLATAVTAHGPSKFPHGDQTLGGWDLLTGDESFISRWYVPFWGFKLLQEACIHKDGQYLSINIFNLIGI